MKSTEFHARGISFQHRFNEFVRPVAFVSGQPRAFYRSLHFLFIEWFGSIIIFYHIFSFLKRSIVFINWCSLDAYCCFPFIIDQTKWKMPCFMMFLFSVLFHFFSLFFYFQILSLFCSESKKFYFARRAHSNVRSASAHSSQLVHRNGVCVWLDRVVRLSAPHGIS